MSSDRENSKSQSILSQVIDTQYANEQLTPIASNRNDYWIRLLLTLIFLLFLVKAAYKEAMILKLGLFFFILIPVSRLCLPVRLVLSMREQSRGRHTIHLPGHVKKNRRRFLFSSQVESIPCLFIYLLSVCISRQFLFVFCFAPGGGSDEEELRRWLGSAFFFFFFFFF